MSVCGIQKAMPCPVQGTPAIENRKDNAGRIVYFSDGLKKSMSQFANAPCTIVEAPMGYGKTTFVRAAAEQLNVRAIWQKIYESTAADFWTGFCTAIAELDEDCAFRLRETGLIEGGLMRRELMGGLDELRVQEPTFLVIDDYQYIKSATADEFLALFIANMPENLHLILITRTRFAPSGELKLKGLIHTLRAEELSFSEADIQRYFLLMGIRLNTEQIKELHRYSEGWVSALVLFALDYRLHGGFVFTSSVPELVYQAIYRPLDEETKEFLLLVCQFDAFNQKQARAVWLRGDVEELLERLLSENAFVTRDDISGEYSIHNILRLCLREQFGLLPQERQREYLCRAGRAYSACGRFLQAMECFCRGGDYDAILAAMQYGEYLRDLYGELKELYIRCYQACPPEAKARYPLAILSFGLDVITQFREPGLFAAACADFRRAMEDNKTLSDDERSQLWGEYELLQTFTKFNDMVAMAEQNGKALSLLKGPARFVYTKDSFTFGSPSLLYLFYRESGRLSGIIEHFSRVPVGYTRTTGGHGQGFMPILRAEHCYMTGDAESARIAAYQGIEEARAGEQGDVELCGLFLLMKLALYAGDAAETQALLAQMEELSRRRSRQHRTYWLRYACDLCRAWMEESLGRTDGVADWVLQQRHKDYLYFISIAYGDMIFGKALLLRGEYERLLGLADSFRRQAGILPNRLALLYTEIHAASAGFRLRRTEEAKAALRRALDIAMPDGFVMPFAENAAELAPVLAPLAGETAYGDFLPKIQRASAACQSAVRAVLRKQAASKAPVLSLRERHAGLLAADGLTNAEIAEALHISHNTVKAELKSLFAKLGINSRLLLKKEMLE